MRNENIQILEDTLQIFHNGYYEKNGKRIPTKLSQSQAAQCHVFLPEDVNGIAERKDFEHVYVGGRMGVECRNMDSFHMALEEYARNNSLFHKAGNGKILVLNFANPVNPGGGVRRGARAQEEDLCRKSSLLFSLESERAKNYYDYNKSLCTYLGSDALILTPDVEIIRDSNGELLDESVVVSAVTCAAPMIKRGMEGLSEEEYQELFYNRICGMLKCAAFWGYPALVLGAFGCGAFGNDAKVVSDLFYKALKEFNYDGMRAVSFFRQIDFAVLDKTENQYNYNEFSRNFADFYREEDNAEIERV